MLAMNVGDSLLRPNSDVGDIFFASKKCNPLSIDVGYGNWRPNVLVTSLRCK